jgi:hypothetical protein
MSQRHATHAEPEGCDTERRRLREILVELTRKACGASACSEEVTILVATAVVESLRHRRSEWLRRGIDPVRASAPEVALSISTSIALVMRTAAEIAVSSGRTEVLVIDLVEAIHVKWCKIFPLCPVS